MNKKAVVHLWGGIGNQLFIYSFGEYLRHRYGLDVYYDLSSYGTTDIRNLEINAVTDHIPEYKTKWYFFTRHTGVFRRGSRILFQALPGVYYTNNVFDESVLSKKYRLLYFDGYWQDKKYAEWMRENMPGFYDTVNSVPDVINNYLKEIEGKDVVSVHIRRGDYLLPQNAHLNVCTAEYYNEALHKIAGEKEGTFMVFSDDVEWVKSNLDFGKEVIYVDDKGVSPFWDIYLMSKCRYHIISNSTFSWWGSFLDINESKRIIAPKRWRNDKENPPLYDKQWELIAIENH